MNILFMLISDVNSFRPATDFRLPNGSFNLPGAEAWRGGSCDKGGCKNTPFFNRFRDAGSISRFAVWATVGQCAP